MDENTPIKASRRVSGQISNTSNPTQSSPNISRQNNTNTSNSNQSSPNISKQNNVNINTSNSTQNSPKISNSRKIKRKLKKLRKKTLNKDDEISISTPLFANQMRSIQTDSPVRIRKDPEQTTIMRLQEPTMWDQSKDFEQWIEKFDLISTANKWDDTMKLTYLGNYLQQPALSFLHFF
jgi:hypothetical protein